MKELPKDQENLAESFRSYLRKKNMSENTGDAYGRTIRQLLVHLSRSEPNLFSENTGVF